MKTKKTICLIFIVFVYNLVATAQLQYSKIKIDLGQTSLRTLGSLGIETEHGENIATK
jgi:hypothetical protein